MEKKNPSAAPTGDCGLFEKSARVALLTALTVCALFLFLQKAQAGIDPSAQDWEPLSSAAGRFNASQEPVRVRLPMMPGRDVQALPAQRVSNPRLAASPPPAEQAALQQKQQQQPQQQPTRAASERAAVSAQEDEAQRKQLEACSTLLTDRRKQKLAALESDRRTLAALRQAMHDLKLTQKLSFLVDDAQDTESGILAPKTAAP